MKCSFKSCPGEYREKLISETYTKNGKIVVITNIPAEVCNFCGDTLLHARVVKAIEALLASGREPEEFVPVLHLPELVA